MDNYILQYIGDSSGVPVLKVFRLDGDGISTASYFVGDEAKQMYNLILGIKKL